MLRISKVFQVIGVCILIVGVISCVAADRSGPYWISFMFGLLLWLLGRMAESFSIKS